MVGHRTQAGGREGGQDPGDGCSCKLAVRRTTARNSQHHILIIAPERLICCASAVSKAPQAASSHCSAGGGCFLPAARASTREAVPNSTEP